MVNKRSISGMVAAFSLFLAFPALSSAHTLSVSASPSQCVSPLNGSYTATITVTEQYFSGTVENIPVGKNVYQLSSSTDKNNKGLNQNYFTQGAVGTQTGPVGLGQPTSFTSPSNGSTATQKFVVTASGTETYVLGNSYMSHPASVTIYAPTSGCTPPPSCPTGQTLVNGVCVPPTGCPSGETLKGGVCVPPTGCPAGETLTGGVCVPPTGCPAGQVLSSGQCVPPTSCPSGQVLSAGQCVPPTSCPSGQVLSAGKCVPPTNCPSGQVLSGGQCVPPTNCPSGQVLSGGKCVPPSGCPAGQVLSGGQCVPPTSCPSGETLSGGQCVPPSACPAGETMSANVCIVPRVPAAPKVFPAVCRASTHGYKVRAGQQDTVIVSVLRHGAPVSGAKVRITVPGGNVLTRSTGKSGKATFTVEPAQSGTILVRSPSCKEMVKVKVYAAKAATALRAPSFTG